MIKSSGKSLLPHISLNSANAVLKPKFNEKNKVSVRKITAAFGLSSDVVTKILQYVNSKKWKSSWLILALQKYPWSTMDLV